MNETLLIILSFLGLLLLPFVIGFLLNMLLGLIKNKPIKNILTVISFIVFLPGMLAFWSAENVTERERKWAPFSYSLKSRSRLVLITYVIYAFAYYWLFNCLLN